MRVIEKIDAFRSLRSELPRTALVPTMGNLHEGHLALIRRAAQTDLPVVVSIFVNPLQFGPNEDFSAYPRTLERDLELLKREGVAVVFAPHGQEFYPEPQTFLVNPGNHLADTLEGQHRPGFFTGVATVVLKLFNIIQPRCTVFGKKDYQQFLVITELCKQFALPIEVIPVETVRHGDGLALSSRNQYLSTAERSESPQLYAALSRITAGLARSNPDIAALERSAASALQKRGWRVDYLSVRNAADLQSATGDFGATAPRLVVLGAAHLGRTRLIDNIELTAMAV